MDKIRSKQESRDVIEKLNLNRVPEVFVNNKDKKKIKKFFDLYKADLYVVRDAEHSSAKYKYVQNYDECLECISDYKGEIIVAVSVNSYKNKMFLGAVEIDGNIIRMCATTNEALDHRTMYNGAEYNFEKNICDKSLNSIPYIDFLVKYLYDNKLLGVTVEFTIYDREVGINQECIIINEVRNY